MSVYKWPVVLTRRDSTRTGTYFVAEFRDPNMDGMLGTGFSEGEAVKDLKQVRREFIHSYEKYPTDGWTGWRRITTNGRSR